MSIYTNGYPTFDDYDLGRNEFVSSRKIGKPMGPDAPHYPNKAERVLLTQMMQKSGQTEKQVRADKSNRQKLAAAAKSMSRAKDRGHRREILLKRLKQSIAASLGVPAYHPDVQKALYTKHVYGVWGISTPIAMLARRTGY